MISLTEKRLSKQFSSTPFAYSLEMMHVSCRLFDVKTSASHCCTEMAESLPLIYFTKEPALVDESLGESRSQELTEDVV